MDPRNTPMQGCNVGASKGGPAAHKLALASPRPSGLEELFSISLQGMRAWHIVYNEGLVDFRMREGPPFVAALGVVVGLKLAGDILGMQSQLVANATFEAHHVHSLVAEQPRANLDTMKFFAGFVQTGPQSLANFSAKVDGKAMKMSTGIFVMTKFDLEFKLTDMSNFSVTDHSSLKRQCRGHRLQQQRGHFGCLPDARQEQQGGPEGTLSCRFTAALVGKERVFWQNAGGSRTRGFGQTVF